ncbi:Oxidoreductase, short chain dehydrogenase/reductase family, partial [Pseudomonas savastanoi pv. glycinea]
MAGLRAAACTAQWLSPANPGISRRTSARQLFGLTTRTSPMPIALITGCSSGIGRALADAFKATGYEVWATARKAEDVAALSAAGFIAVQLDVNDGLALEQLAAGLEHSGLDVLINNAGYGAMGPLLDGGVEALQRQFETNVFSVIGVTRALFAALRRN